MESHTKRFLRIFLSSSATFLQYLQSSSSSSFSGHTPPFLPSHFFIQGSYSGSLVFSALDEKEQESEFVAVNPARRSHRYIVGGGGAGDQGGLRVAGLRVHAGHRAAGVGRLPVERWYGPAN